MRVAPPQRSSLSQIRGILTANDTIRCQAFKKHQRILPARACNIKKKDEES